MPLHNRFGYLLMQPRRKFVAFNHVQSVAVRVPGSAPRWTQLPTMRGHQCSYAVLTHRVYLLTSQLPKNMASDVVDTANDVCRTAFTKRREPGTAEAFPPQFTIYSFHNLQWRAAEGRGV